MRRGSARGVARKLGWLALLLTLAIVAGALAGYVGNRRLPGPPPDPGHLEPLDKARLSEALRLRRTHGDEVWPGWGTASLPLRVTNGWYQFLIDHPAPPADWEQVTDDDYEGRPYWRRQEEEEPRSALPRGGVVEQREDRMRLDGLPVAYAPSKRAMDRTLIREFARPIPDPLKPFVPYWPLVQSTEVYLASVLNSMMQAHLAQRAPARVRAARLAFENIGGYPFAHAVQVKMWPDEVAALIAAAEEPDAATSKEAARSFLKLRAKRRAIAELDAWSVHLERQAEWLKGIAFYGELSVWRLARDAQAPPVTGLDQDPYFRGYATYDGRWSEVLAVARSCAARPCPMRFQYTGMLQAVFLGRHLTNWQERALMPDVTLEALVAEISEAGD